MTHEEWWLRRMVAGPRIAGRPISGRAIAAPHVAGRHGPCPDRRDRPRFHRERRWSLIALMVAALASCAPSTVLQRDIAEEGTWRTTGAHATASGHIGALTRGSIFQAFLLHPGLHESGVLSAVGAYEIGGYFLETGEQIGGIELEASVSQHFGYQSHGEATVAAVVRWHAFLFDDVVEATASASQGLSWATAVPRIEEERWNNATQLLSHNSYEFTMADPDRPEIALVFRLHHRSGVWGLFGDVEEGSNLAMMGLKFRFDLD